MKVYAIFYTDVKYCSRKDVLLGRFRSAGFDKVVHYNREWLETTGFYLKNKAVLDLPKGGGYWLWKPYILMETMKRADNGDFVFYSDAGDAVNVFAVLKMIRQHAPKLDYLISGGSRRPLNRHYTKRDCFVLMDCDEAKYYNVCQVEAGAIALKKTGDMVLFLEEWLSYCEDANILTDIPNVHGNNLDGFIEHRHDQSVLTNLMVRHNMKYSNELYKKIKFNVFRP